MTASVRSFREWKAYAAVKLMEIRKKYEGNEKIVRDVNALLSKLEYLKVRDLASFTILLHRASAGTKEFLELLPTTDEVKAWLSKGEV